MAVPAGKDYWGKAAAEASNSQEMDGKDVKPEKEECTICMEECVSVQVRFRPCKHGACAGCVLKLRREVVFKVSAAQNVASQRLEMSGKTQSELLRYDSFKHCLSYCPYESLDQGQFVMLLGIALSEVVRVRCRLIKA